MEFSYDITFFPGYIKFKALVDTLVTMNLSFIVNVSDCRVTILVTSKLEEPLKAILKNFQH